MNRRSVLTYIPGYKNNAVLQLIIVCGSAYLTLAIAWSIIMIIYSGSWGNFNMYFLPNISLTPLETFKSHWWTILTYGWFQPPNSFIELIVSMLWLYTFGSVVQVLIGPKHVIPLYTYSLLAGGVFYMLAQLLPANITAVAPSFLSGRAGVMGMAVAAIVLTPGYKFFITPKISIPLFVVFLVFCGLMVLRSDLNVPVLALVAGGGIMGAIYIKLVQAGYKPAAWAYRSAAWVEGLVTPKEKPAMKKLPGVPGSNIYSMYQPKQGISQLHIDEILDKINQKGYNSLSKEEKDILLRAGRE